MGYVSKGRKAVVSQGSEGEDIYLNFTGHRQWAVFVLG